MLQYHADGNWNGLFNHLLFWSINHRTTRATWCCARQDLRTLLALMHLLLRDQQELDWNTTSYKIDYQLPSEYVQVHKVSKRAPSYCYLYLSLATAPSETEASWNYQAFNPQTHRWMKKFTTDSVPWTRDWLANLIFDNKVLMTDYFYHLANWPPGSWLCSSHGPLNCKDQL